MRTVDISIQRQNLIYDIGNYAYIEAHRRDTAAAHIIADICQDGNADRMARVLALAYGQVRLMLRHHCIDDDCSHTNYTDGVWTPECYTLQLRLSHNIRGRQLHALTGAIHEYMACFALAHWLEMTGENASYWHDCVRRASGKIMSCLNVGGCFLRRLPPF